MADHTRALDELAEAVMLSLHPEMTTRNSARNLETRFVNLVKAVSSSSTSERDAAFARAGSNHRQRRDVADRSAPYGYCQIAMTGKDSGPDAYDGPPCCPHFEVREQARNDADAPAAPSPASRRSRSYKQMQRQNKVLKRRVAKLRRDMSRSSATIRNLQRQLGDHNDNDDDYGKDDDDYGTDDDDYGTDDDEVDDDEHNFGFKDEDNDECECERKFGFKGEDNDECKFGFNAKDDDEDDETSSTDSENHHDLLHLAGDAETVKGQLTRILYGTSWDSDRQRSVTRLFDHKEVTDGCTADALVRLDLDVIARYGLRPKRLVSYTTDYTTIMQSTTRRLSLVINHRIMPIGCALHANELEVHHFLNAVELSAGSSAAPGGQDVSSAHQLLKLLNTLHCTLQGSLLWYREQAQALCGWQLALYPATLWARWPSVADQINWAVENRTRIVDFARALYADGRTGLPDDGKAWSSTAAALTNPRTLSILFMMHDFFQMWTLPNYLWFLADSAVPDCSKLFRAAECPRRAAHMWLSLGAISTLPHDEQIKPYATLNDHLAQLDRTGTLGDLKTQAAACVASAHQKTLSAVQNYMACTWLSTPAVLFALGDPACAARVVRAAAFVNERECGRWDALFGFKPESHYTPAQLALIDKFYESTPEHGLFDAIAKTRGSSQLLVDGMDDFNVELLFILSLQRQVMDVDALLDSTFAILAEWGRQDCFSEIARDGHLHFDRHDKCPVHKWIRDVVYPTPHTNLPIKAPLRGRKIPGSGNAATQCTPLSALGEIRRLGCPGPYNDGGPPPFMMDPAFEEMRRFFRGG